MIVKVLDLFPEIEPGFYKKAIVQVKIQVFTIGGYRRIPGTPAGALPPHSKSGALRGVG